MTRPRRLTPSTATISTKAFADRITRPPSDLARMLDRTSKRAVTDADLLPPIPFNFKHRQRDVFIYIVFILACNLAVPCILYYCLVNYTNLSEHALLGIGAASLGISSCVDHPYRSWKLFGHREYYGPLGDDNRWHFDALKYVFVFCVACPQCR